MQAVRRRVVRNRVVARRAANFQPLTAGAEAWPGGCDRPLSPRIRRLRGVAQLAHELAAEEHYHDQYTYVSGASSTWVEHCREYADQLINQFGLGPEDLVVEAGSNDG